MDWMDFFIGFFLMNAMPHFVLGIWDGRILSLYGFGKTQNILYGLTCFAVSTILYVIKYGWTIPENGIYLGALTILLIYFVTGRFVRDVYKKAD